jgi:dTDP-4-amino-4,6-dideoxygalactose transaminase
MAFATWNLFPPSIRAYIKGLNMQDLSSHSWPNHHAAGRREIELLEIALAEKDWSHSSLSAQFESRFATYIGAKHALLVPSGTMAVYMSLLALGIRPGQEVIVPGITWPSVIYSIIKAGGIPVTVDIDEATLCMDCNAVRASVNSKTFAILATHIFGSQCDMKEIVLIARESGLQIVEDSAQSIGSSQSGRRCGTWGAIGTFSLNDRKILACGEGGVVVTDDTAVYEELKRFQLIQPERPSPPRNLPGTYKISEFQAAVALAQLEALEGKLLKMQENAKHLESLLVDNETVSVQGKPSSVDLQSYYNFCLIYKGKKDTARVRGELSRRLNLSVSAPYRPLSGIVDFAPTGRDLPKSAKLAIGKIHPNCQNAFLARGIRLPHVCLLESREIIDALGAIIAEAVAD